MPRYQPRDENMSRHQPIRVMHVVQSLDTGGLENGVVNLLNRLHDERFNHAICCLTHAGKLAERIRCKHIPIVEVGLKTDRFHFPLLTLRRLIRAWSPDLLHTRGWGTIDGIMAARVAGVPRVIHGEHGREAADPNGRNRKRNFIRRCLSPMVDRFVSVSDDLKNWLTDTVGIPERKVVRIHNGVDTEKFAPRNGAQRAERMEQGAQPSALGALRQALGLPAEGLLIGTVGRLDPVKDHDSLLQAFAPLARAAGAVRLVIVGDGPMRKGIESTASQLGVADKIVLLGERHDVASLLSGFDVFALTSIAEGISNTILEAMASGLPVVATRVGGNPELIEHGVSGQLITAQDVSALGSALLAYVTSPDLRRSHGAAARQRAVDEFSLDRMAAQYADLYFSVMGKPARWAEGSVLRADS